MNESGTGSAGTRVEERLRAALAARAESVGPADLRPLAPPPRARSTRVLLRRAAVGILALAAVAALVFFTVRGGPDRPAEPARPPRPPGPAVGTPSPVPSSAAPSAVRPSPSTPQP
ncbi:hypothetical protein SAMN05428944_1256 [Streptomyces sp. 1222.5]|uniref:hypothetical protein n=1 Tax=unclassified Streptomyces TaxID=2593676 RepID=UPI00089CA20F|nr:MULTISPECIES: hypothetical protein [unclassified Streptomyces]PKW11522.1 hypothetical protein BX260_6838 [Streptomyces sp. 5112.2]SEB76793.1 hypothetical protein SAMN05428944_1256 [Streptomyces sp. 1222.5]